MDQSYECTVDHSYEDDSSSFNPFVESTLRKLKITNGIGNLSASETKTLVFHVLNLLEGTGCLFCSTNNFDKGDANASISSDLNELPEKEFDMFVKSTLRKLQKSIGLRSYSALGFHGIDDDLKICDGNGEISEGEFYLISEKVVRKLDKISDDVSQLSKSEMNMILQHRPEALDNEKAATHPSKSGETAINSFRPFVQSILRQLKIPNDMGKLTDGESRLLVEFILSTMEGTRRLLRFTSTFDRENGSNAGAEISKMTEREFSRFVKLLLRKLKKSIHVESFAALGFDSIDIHLKKTSKNSGLETDEQSDREFHLLTEKVLNKLDKISGEIKQLSNSQSEPNIIVEQFWNHTKELIRSLI